ncbi:MAG: hypothetical protein WKF70_09530 [Chitinophagaceae bacterium]
MIRNYLAKNLALASMNYKLLNPKNTQGVLMCFKDNKRALQYIRYHSKILNIDKSKVVSMGGSAGAGTSLWLAFNDGTAEKNSPILSVVRQHLVRVLSHIIRRLPKIFFMDPGSFK